MSVRAMIFGSMQSSIKTGLTALTNLKAAMLVNGLSRELLEYYFRAVQLIDNIYGDLFCLQWSTDYLIERHGLNSSELAPPSVKNRKAARNLKVKYYVGKGTPTSKLPDQVDEPISGRNPTEAQALASLRIATRFRGY